MTMLIYYIISTLMCIFWIIIKYKDNPSKQKGPKIIYIIVCLLLGWLIVPLRLLSVITQILLK